MARAVPLHSGHTQSANMWMDVIVCPATDSLPDSSSVYTALEAPEPLPAGNTEEFIPIQQRQKSEAIKPQTLGLWTPSCGPRAKLPFHTGRK